jgi:hypothetical protein
MGWVVMRKGQGGVLDRLLQVQRGWQGGRVLTDREWAGWCIGQATTGRKFQVESAVLTARKW